MKHKAFMLLFTLIFTLILIIYFSSTLYFDIDNISNVSKILFFDRFIDEYAIVSLLLFLFIQKKRIFTIVAILILFIYISIATTQLITYLISGELLSRLALNNVEFIGFLLTFENIKLVIISLIILIFIPSVLSYFMIKRTSIVDFLNHKLFMIIMIFLFIISHNTNKYIDEKYIDERDIIFSKNHFYHTGSIQALANLYKEEKGKILSFKQTEIDLLDNINLSLDFTSKYPLMKETVYQNSLPFKHTLERPNVIVIFTEGFSARTTSIYSNKYDNLTPNLKKFTENNHTMTVKQFYNHTAATYRGLHGQLCSLFPKYGEGDMWFDNEYLNLSSINYKCLPHILQNNHYETIYLNMHYKNQSANDEMVSNFGFDTILSAEELSKKYLGGINHIKSQYLSDHQSYDVLTAYLKEKEKDNNKPFFLATYTIETHAFLDTEDNGIKYKSGKNNVLNTIHNMDDAFGEFWNYFKNSTFADNTLIFFTSDHAHYYGKDYIKTMKEYQEDNYHQVFIDKVPLLIYAPNMTLPNVWNAQQATSIDLAPTILHLLQIKNTSNAFIGTSLFEKNRKDFGISSYGKNLYMIKKNNLIYFEGNVLEKDQTTFHTIKKFIQYTHQLEEENRLFHNK